MRPEVRDNSAFHLGAFLFGDGKLESEPILREILCFFEK
jgi:hypothetical protein